MNESVDECSLCFIPVLLCETYNEDEIKYLIQKALEQSVVFFVYIRFRNKIKKDPVRLSPVQVVHIWQSPLKLQKLLLINENNIKKTVKINLHSLMIDKNIADFYLNLAYEGIDN